MKTSCPYCGYIATEHETLDLQTDPKENDISFCILCGEISRYKSGKLKKVNINFLPKELKAEVAKIKDAWKQAKEIANSQNVD